MTRFIAQFMPKPNSGPISVETAKDRLAVVQSAIHQSLKIAGRKADAVTLIAISKTHDAPQIIPFLQAGHRTFGENRVQEAQEKWPDLKQQFSGILLHMVGQLQSNKAEEAVALFDTIHSLDRPSLATALAKAMDRLDKRIPCFIQVNIGGEPQKGGCAIGALPDLLDQARDLELPVTGLMCVPPFGLEPSPYFALLAKIGYDHGLTQLSMGMSGDFESAVRIGATHIRVGSTLFGQREAD